MRPLHSADRPHFESIEPRLYLSHSDPTAKIVGEVLVISGTLSQDSIIINARGHEGRSVHVQIKTPNGRYTRNGKPQFSHRVFQNHRKTFRYLMIMGLDGNDRIQANQSRYPLPRALLLFGNRGQDTIIGSTNADRIDGGEDMDFIYAVEGNDRIHGGGDDSGDFIDGGDGDDRVQGQDGADRLWGGGGDDTLVGGNGTDWLAGGTGADFLRGGPDNDTLRPGKYPYSFGFRPDEEIGIDDTSADTVNGDSGRNSIYGQDGSADVIRNRRRDVVYEFDDSDGFGENPMGSFPDKLL